MEAAIRFSQNSLPGQADQYFLKVDIAGRALQIYNIKKERKSSLDYQLVYASEKLQPFRAFDWHPLEASLVAIGQTGGEASLVNLADAQQSPAAFSVRSQRSCNAVGLNTENWIAIGLDKVRNDFCLNIWDVNQRLTGASKGYWKSSGEPLHKLASGEPITSLRFFQDQPPLLAAGFKGQFIRLYDLRESTSSSALQFATRCVNNIVVDTQDENYFASCLPANSPTVSIWDRRMVSRTNIAHSGFSSYVGQADRHPEVSVELRNVVDPQGQIWGLRFSKTQRGHLGVLSSTGQLRMLRFSTDMSSQTGPQNQPHLKSLDWDRQIPQGIFLDNTQNFSNAFSEHPSVEEVRRIVSFDFTTAKGPNDHPKIITLSGDGIVEVREVVGSPAPFAISSSTSFFDGKGIENKPVTHTSVKNEDLPSRQPTTMAFDGSFRLLKPAEIIASNLTMLISMRQRCDEGYLLDAARNVTIADHDEKLRTFWSWLKHASDISDNHGLVHDDIDLSFLGVFGFWMEEVDLKLRITKSALAIGNSRTSFVIRELAKRLHLTQGKGCATEYPQNRALCLHIGGLPWSHDDIGRECDKLVADGELAKAAAVAIFAGEERIAQKALRAKGSSHSHKMLAMALVGARNRHRKTRRGSHGSGKSQHSDSDSSGSEDREWKDIISAVAEDLTDCYSRCILAYVKTGDWEDVVKQPCLPLRYQVNIALRHFDDAKLTRFLSSLKHEIISSGDLEGVFVTGLGTPESIDLLKSYARITNDIQTAALGMSFAAASDRFLPRDSSHARTVFCFRETYKAQLLASGLKFDKVRFTIAISRTLREHDVATEPRKREQIRLICSYCNQSISQFGHEQQTRERNAHMTETTKHPLAPEKAAVAGVICPQCGRHLPRCGVCDLWLGTPDETFSKWYRLSRSGSARNSNSVDLSASLVGSTVTAIGPGSKTSSVSVSGAKGTIGEAKKLTTADLEPDVVEVVDEEVAKRERERKWYEAMHKLTVFCTVCSHGFHAEHAKMWFEGSDGREGHRVCPVPLCECLCNG